MKQTVFEKFPPDSSVIDDALSGSKLESFWLDDIASSTASLTSPRETRADLLIVGAGFLGLWTALLAKERDPQRSVVVIEASRVGAEASGRNGGFCEASITHGEKNGMQRWPDEYAQLEAIGARNLVGFEDDLRKYGIECDFERNGLLTVATEPYQVDGLRGPGFLNREETQEQLASPTYLASNWERTGTALLHPGKLTAGLARAAKGLGVQILEGVRAHSLQRLASGIGINTSAGRMQGAQVILATNAFPSLLARYRLHTVPVYDYVLMTQPLSETQLASIGWKNRQGVTDLGNQFHYYRLTADNRILFGGYDAIYHYGRKIDRSLEDRGSSFYRLASHFFTTFPQLAGLKFSHRWAGVIDTSTRFCAFFGKACDGRVFHAAGFTGLGVGATRFAANVLLDLAEHKDTELTRLRMVRETPIPFPPEPLAYATIRATQWSLERADRNEGRRNLLLKLQSAFGLGFDS